MELIDFPGSIPYSAIVVAPPVSGRAASTFAQVQHAAVMHECRFQLESFVGALPLRFGMTEAELESIVGPPASRSADFLGGTSLDYYPRDICIGLDRDTGLATHFAFGRQSDVTFRGISVYGSPNSWREIVALSSDCQEWVGFILLLDLGLSLSGFHDHDLDQMGVAVFPRGRHDHKRPRFKPFVLS